MQLLQVRTPVGMWTKAWTHPGRNDSAIASFFLFNLRSDKDPSGLLLLPPKRAPADFEVSPILSVMETLLLVATREVKHPNICTQRKCLCPCAQTSLSPQCEVMMVDGSDRASRTVLLSLFWALQGSLLTWCYLQLKVGSTSAVNMDLAREVLAKCEILHCFIYYVMQITVLHTRPSVRTLLQSISFLPY